MGYNPAPPAPGPRVPQTCGRSARARAGTADAAEALTLDAGVASVVLERPQRSERGRSQRDEGGDWADLRRERRRGDHSAQESAALVGQRPISARGGGA